MDSNPKSNDPIKFRFLKQKHLEESKINALNDKFEANDLLKSIQEPNFDERFPDIIEKIDVDLFLFLLK